MQEGLLTSEGSYPCSVGNTCVGGSTPCSRELFMFRTEGSTSARGSAHFRRELFLFSREHLCRRECSLQQGAIHIQQRAPVQERALTTTESYSYSVGSTSMRECSLQQGAIYGQYRSPLPEATALPHPPTSGLCAAPPSYQWPVSRPAALLVASVLPQTHFLAYYRVTFLTRAPLKITSF